MEKISWLKLREADLIAEALNIPIRICISSDDSGDMDIVSESDAKSMIKSHIESRPENSHKGTFGRLTAVTGSDRFPGAAAISTEAALRSGAGLVSVVTTKQCAVSLSAAVRECTLLPCHCDENGFISPDERTLCEVEKLIGSSSAVLIGCGIGTGAGAMRILEAVIELANCPIIIDADGINLVSTRIELLRKAKTEVILTPHPAELSRLCGVSVKEALENRYPLAKKLADEYGVTVMSKSCATLIVTPEKAYVTAFGNNGLSKGGSGDMLAGLTASFAAQGVSPLVSATMGSAVLGLSCEYLSKSVSKMAALASDLIKYLPELFKNFERS